MNDIIEADDEKKVHDEFVWRNKNTGKEMANESI
jgi:hypothetical protein